MQRENLARPTPASVDLSNPRRILAPLSAALALLASVAAHGGLGVGVEVNPVPARPGEQRSMEATVTNTDGTPHASVTITRRPPEGIPEFDPRCHGLLEQFVVRPARRQRYVRERL